MENDSNQKKKSRFIKTSEYQEKIIGYHTKFKKKTTPTTGDSGCCQSKYELEKATNKYHNNTGINYKKW